MAPADQHLAATAAGGYVMLVAVVILYYDGVARAGSRFVESAISGCALLLGLSMPVFLAASWLAERRSHRPGAGERSRLRAVPVPLKRPAATAAAPTPAREHRESVSSV